MITDNDKLAEEYLEVNRKSWNDRLESHWNSQFYDVENFIKGRSSLNTIELDLLGDIANKSLLHLQCHFGQDTISLSRLGAQCTGVDLSDKAIEKARELNLKCGTNANFLNVDIFNLPQVLDNRFDIVFTSYGTITWLPDVEKWAQIVSQYLKPGGRFIFAEFHPVVWMFDDDVKEVTYRYFNDAPIIEEQTGTYAQKDLDKDFKYVCWNHGLGEVISALLQAGLQLDILQEFDYSPYDCLGEMVEVEKGKYRIKNHGNKMPLIYALSATKI